MKGFHARATAWLRDEMNQQFADIPLKKTSQDPEYVRTTGAIADRRAGAWAYAGIYSLTIASVLAMALGRPALDPTLVLVLECGAIAATVAAVALFGTAFRRNRRRRRTAIELRFAGGGPAVEPEHVRSFRDEAGGDEHWLVSEVPFSTAAIDEANRLGVRGVEARGPGFALVTKGA